MQRRDSDDSEASSERGGAAGPPGRPLENSIAAAPPRQDYAAAAHVLDQYRAEALMDIDKAGFSWFHLKVCWVVGVGFFTDALVLPLIMYDPFPKRAVMCRYDIFAINLATVMLGYVYGHTTGPSSLSHRLSNKQDFGIKVAAPIGNLIGQLSFGWLADIVGRKRMYGVELMIIVSATFCQALAGSGPGVNIVGVLIVYRFIMGVGVGGDYPLSAVIASEFASTRTRGRLMTAVFTAQGWGNLAASIVALATIMVYKDSIIADNFDQPGHVDYCWRILIGLGCVPGAIALYFRLTIPETPRFTMDIDRDVQKAKADIENVLNSGPSAAVYWVDPDAIVQRAQAPRRGRKDFIGYLSYPGNLQLIFGVAYSWFAVDVAFYGLGLNSSSILTSALLTRAGIGDVIDPSELNTTLGIFKSLHNIAIGSLVVAVAGLLPGYYASFFLIDFWGRKPIQFLGFGMLTLLLAILAGIYPGPEPDSSLLGRTEAFVALYCLANFFTNFGPNVTTFVIPGEIFPTRYRSTAHGFAAACGKLGAIVSQIIFFKVNNSDGTLKTILGIFAGVTLTGIVSTWLLEETKDKSLEQLSGEQQRGFIYGVTPVRMQDGVVHRQGGL
ncbi:major facilitator superfamily domain-containing protein [Russula earlei]|uniref:Major facilitator superfamily domain-containing protein n=1 Tax=Russula earlei TaxID=71964 RepID=A0ACC0U5D6_9AGAM|nr:major facilitator superfamily domain-containing protein [Russula earlei]